MGKKDDRIVLHNHLSSWHCTVDIVHLYSIQPNLLAFRGEHAGGEQPGVLGLRVQLHPAGPRSQHSPGTVQGRLGLIASPNDVSHAPNLIMIYIFHGTMN